MKKGQKKWYKVWLLALVFILALSLPALAAESVTTIACGDEILIQGEGAATDGQTIEITKPGHYVLAGKLLGGRVLVKVRGGEVTLELAGFYGENSQQEVIDLRQAASVCLRLGEESHNTLLSGRLEELGAVDGGGAALEADCPLRIEGTGALDIYGCLNNGLSCEGALELAGGQLQIQSAREGVKAQSLLLDGAELTVTALDDGLELAGTMESRSGSLFVRAARDGIDGEGDISLSGGTIAIYTDGYAFSEETLAGITAAEEELVTAEEISFKVKKTLYNETDQYYALFFSDSGASVWVEILYDKPGSQNVYYSLDAPAGFPRFVIYRYTEAQAPRSTEIYDACTDTLELGDKEIYTVSSVQNGHMAGSWGTQNSGNSWMSWGNPYKRDYSCKGLKSAGNITVSGGEITLACWDDAIHAAGYVAIHDGDLTLSAVDDGIHADGELYINGGSVDILTAYEGLEGYNIYMNGGSVTADCWDDGTNAGLYFVMNGGSLDLTLPSGDTDGLDANYALWMTGGYICVRSDAYGGVAGTIDTGWGGATVNGGTLLGIGAIAETPHSGNENVNYAYFSQSFPAGDYALLDGAGQELLRFRVEERYSGGFISSDLLVLGESYQITQDGNTYLRWTQDSARQTVRR